MRSSTASALSALVLMLTACGRPAPTREDAGSGPSLAESATPIDAPGDGRARETADSAAASDGAARADAHALLGAPPVRARSIGHTSVVLKLELEGGGAAAFKPESARGPGRYRGEIAAYRLAKWLALPNVPDAFVRTFDRDALVAAAGGASSETGRLLVSELRPRDGRLVDGALLPWRARLDMLPLEREPRRSEVLAWLRHDVSIAERDRSLAAQVSRLLAFDWLTGNWDRWSGANIAWDEPTKTLLFIDNDGAFYPRPPEAALARTRSMLEAADRVPRALVDKVRSLDEATLRAALGADAAGAPLLADRVVLSVVARARAYVELVDKKSAKLGDGAVLFFD